MSGCLVIAMDDNEHLFSGNTEPISEFFQTMENTIANSETLTQQLRTMQSIQVFGQTIRYHDLGSGPVLVLLHGLASSALLDWGKVMPSLAATHRVLAMDQIGYGSSARLTVEFRIQTYVTSWLSFSAC
jgi:hypothetical protein